MRRITCLTDFARALFCMLLWVPITSGQQTSATGTLQPVAGSTVVVKTIETVDSSSDPAGKQYRAGLIRPVDVGNGVIVAQGSVVTLTLARSTSGWGVQLSSLVINGQVVPVTSKAGSVIGAAAQSDVANAAKAASSVLGVLRKKPNPVPVVAPVASGERVILPPGTSLSFVLNATPAANGPAPANPVQANASALPANQPGRSYYCTFNDTARRPNITHYFSGVFQADAGQIEVSKAWTDYIRQTYLPGDNRDSGSCQIGAADQQQRVETALRQTWQVMAAGSERSAQMKIPTNTVVDVGWKYVPDHPSASSATGTPPSTAAAAVGPPAYTASAATAAQPPAAAAGQVAPPQTRNRPQTAAATAQSLDTSITGVYNGHLICTRVHLNLKLALIAAPDGSLTGFFIVEWPRGIPGYPPPDSGSRFTYKLSSNGRNYLPSSTPDGRTVGTAGSTLTATPWGTPAPSDCSMQYVRFRYNIGSDMISGSIDNPSRSDFNLIRDKAESPTAVAAAAESQPTTNPQASTTLPAPTPASAGVQAAHAATIKNAAAVTEPTATTSRIMVIICRDDPPGGLTGLPVPDHAAASGKAAVNDGDWIARLIQRLKEHAQERKWDVLTPSASENHICVYLTVALPYKFDSSNAVAAVASIWKLTDEIPTLAGLRINSIYASPPPSVAQVALAKAQDERVAALRAAPPAQLASQGLVRKSKAYWDAYSTDLIRQVFDGGFGSDVDSGTQFRELFTTYVEMFAKSCSASMPAHHEAVIVGQQALQSWTVEVDSRFAPYYRKYAEFLLSSSQTLAGALGVASGRVSANAFFAPGTDMIRFSETNTCKSAAMRQLGENLLRAAKGNPSLQQDGATIAGAAAETDRSLPPGRYARFVDGCNGFFRDPANARLRSSHSSAWCDCLGEKYQRMMSRDEEYYYANNFENRFWSQIAQPTSTDPASPRLHPAVDDCVDETNK